MSLDLPVLETTQLSQSQAEIVKKPKIWTLLNNLRELSCATAGYENRADSYADVVLTYKLIWLSCFFKGGQCKYIADETLSTA